MGGHKYSRNSTTWGRGSKEAVTLTLRSLPCTPPNEPIPSII